MLLQLFLSLKIFFLNETVFMLILSAPVIYKMKWLKLILKSITYDVIDINYGN